MATSKPRFAHLLIGAADYFRENEEASFPWDASDSSVWYCLLVVEHGQIMRYGFTSADSSKSALCSALRSLSPDDQTLLLGVWTGTRRTNLFVLAPSEALAQLEGAKRFARFEKLGEITEAELVREGRSKYLSYTYRSAGGYLTHTYTRRRAEIEMLLEYLSTLGLPVKERRE